MAQGNLERAAYGALLPHLMKEMIPDTSGRYYFIPLLPVGAPASLVQHFAKVIQPRECSSPEAYRALLDRYYPATENSEEPFTNRRACVLRCGHAVAVMQSRENLFEKQPFAVELPRWVTGVQARKEAGGVRLSWTKDAAANSYAVWERIPGAKVYPEWRRLKAGIKENSILLAGTESGTFGVSAVTTAKRRWEGTVNYGDYLLFTTEESPIMEQAVVTPDGCRVEPIVWTDESLPARQEVWRIFDGADPSSRRDAEAVLEAFGGLIAAYEAKDLDRLMSFYSPDYRDANGYSTEYVRRAWLWWYQRTVIPYVVTQVRRWDTSRAAEGIISFNAWNLFRATIVWDEPFGYHGRVRIPRHEGQSCELGLEARCARPVEGSPYRTSASQLR